MIKFHYKATDKKLKPPKAVSGYVEAISVEQAVKILKKRDLLPIRLDQVKRPFYEELSANLLQKITLGDIASFTRNVSTMVTAGLPLTDTLSLLKGQVPQKMVPVIEEILFNVESGNSLAESLSRHPEVFSRVYIAFVRAGESAGVLDRVFQRLADTLEKQKEFQSKMKGAMVYPIIIISAMLGVVVLMMVYIIPKMMGIYAEFEAELPLPTMILIKVSEFSAKNLPLFLVLGLVGLYGLSVYRKTEEGKLKVDQFLLTVPVFGELQKHVVLTEISRTLGLLVGAGVQIVEALNIVAEASSSAIFERDIREAAKQVERGMPVAQSIAQSGNFPPLMSQLISIGEETGKMDEVLSKIAHYFESESEEKLRRLTTAIEPLIIVLLGVGVAFLVVAIIMPIYNLTSQF